MICPVLSNNFGALKLLIRAHFVTVLRRSFGLGKPFLVDCFGENSHPDDKHSQVDDHNADPQEGVLKASDPTMAAMNTHVV